MLAIVDNFSRKCLTIHAGKSLKGSDVVEVMETITFGNEVLPKRIKVDDGSEFISKVLEEWAYGNGVELDFPRPGKPTDNPFIESFNDSFRDEWVCKLKLCGLSIPLGLAPKGLGFTSKGILSPNSISKLPDHQAPILDGPGPFLIDVPGCQIDPASKTILDS
ncbi:DDE-type integrase/transposase/recombinase [Pseudozobellia thermophila]|uniref:Integrase core domain-containing protein n=1 Tax=Pseudozobellia thermophila TaxID=192903 RepID=A0A1M6GP96_9FLAO|nr:DDE-type integrase/transposase/recombinase [Pseudozobellia thermophila]SHJ11680.1 Integrase core domain-containing protein [Pseudozobellia thermophila]